MKKKIFFSNCHKSLRGLKWLLLFLFGAGQLFAQSTGTWIQKANFPGTARVYAVGFSIGNKGYIGTGYDGTETKDFWEYDPADTTIGFDINHNPLGKWTQKADFPGVARDGAVGFSIGNKGYIGTGGNYNYDFWEYNPGNDTWKQKDSLPKSAGRYGAVGFSIGKKGYIGIGRGHNSGCGCDQGLWEWDGDTTSVAYNSWTKKADFGGGERWAAVGFSIDTIGYIGNGLDCVYNGNQNDFWEWDQSTNTWMKDTNLIANGRHNAVGFSIGKKGYLGTGTLGGFNKDFWQWNPTNNTWIQKTPFGGTGRFGAVGFSIGNKGYIGTGMDNSGVTNDFWEFQ